MTTHPLIQNLQNPAAYDHPISYFKILETHISWVILTGEYAYKIKKPVDFGFLNYATLEQRQFYCTEEIRLNQPFAPQLYLGVVPINGNADNPVINSDGAIVEYAVKMREFPQHNLFADLLARQEITLDHMDELAQLIADFHQKIPVAPLASAFGTPLHAHAPVEQNFTQIRPLLTEAKDLQQLARLQEWSEQQFQRHQDLLTARKAQGFIRECHGDLHLQNIILFDGRPLLFDRIEFNEDFRWTDVMADVAFLAMDLDDKQQPTYARHFINHYLMHTGDYAGLALLPYYQAYRAIVRAKIALFSLPPVAAANNGARENCWRQYRGFMALAARYAQVAKPKLLLTCGVAGSGKSTVASKLADNLGVIQIRSDVERKRLMQLTPYAKSHSTLSGGIYQADVTEKTYAHLAELAQIIIAAGYSVIVDASFLKKAQRDSFFALAKKLHIPFIILACQTPSEQIKTWLEERQKKINEPSEADLNVLAWQQENNDALTAEEQQFVVQVNAADFEVEELRLIISSA